MSTQTLQDSSYRTIGYIETEYDGRQVGKDASYRIVGYYYPQSNETKDDCYRMVGHGNLLASLITCPR
jgi:hypothetical protein